MSKSGNIILSLFVVIILFSCASDPRDKSFDLTNRAFNEYWGQDWEKVIELTTRAIKVDYEYPWPYSVRGAAYNATGEYEKAYRDLTKAIDLSPDFGPAFTNRGITLLRMGRYEDALFDLKEAEFLSPHEVIILINIAEVYSAMKKETLACEYAKLAAKFGFKGYRILHEQENFSTIYRSACYNEILEIIDGE